MTQTTTQSLLTADDVAERLGVPSSWVYAQARQNKIPSVPLGHYRRFRPEAIDAWVEAMEKSSARVQIEQGRGPAQQP